MTSPPTLHDSGEHPMLHGSIPALVTPFRNGLVDEKAFAALVERQIDGGAHGLVAVGTTGESATLSFEEHERVIEVCIEAAAGRVPVIAGAGGNATDEALRLMRHAKAAGADGVLVVTPYYNRPSQEGLFQHYRTLAEGVDIPMVLYNVPGRTGVDMRPETVARAAALPNVVGLKDATGDLGRVARHRELCGPDFVLLSGDDASALGFNAHGGCGAVSVTANVAPGLYADMQNACARGDFAAARALNDRLAGLHDALFADASPGPAKYALARLGLIEEELRLPLTRCSQAARQAIDAALLRAGL